MIAMLERMPHPDQTQGLQDGVALIALQRWESEGGACEQRRAD
jgi:hypothetical protein